MVVAGCSEVEGYFVVDHHLSLHLVVAVESRRANLD